MVTKRFDVWLVELDPTIGSEIKKIRPAVIVSSDEMNRHLNTAIIAPMTTVIKNYPTRIKILIQKKAGEIAFDQIRAVDKSRLIEKIGTIDYSTHHLICSTLKTMFEY
ncbi:MAG: transcriptional regulator [Ignavibacteria bacterium]|nr:transcriptional regulator [Ignavibacteria bacterium]